MRVSFEGRVQGVGFRYTVTEVARHRKVTGYVANVYDGSVDLLAEGKKSELEAFLQDIYRSSVGHRIREAHTRWGSATGRYDGFTVRFC